MANKYYILKCFTKGLKGKTVSGQLPPGFLPPPPWKLPLRINAPQAIAPVENCPQEKMFPDNCSVYDYSWKIISKVIAPDKIPLKIAPWQNPPENCPQGKLLFRWFVAYIRQPRKAAPRNIVPRINYIWYIFSPRIRNHSTSVSSCFLLFSFLWFQSVLDFDFSIRKNFIKTVKLKLLKNKEQVKNKILK